MGLLDLGGEKRIVAFLDMRARALVRLAGWKGLHNLVQQPNKREKVLSRLLFAQPRQADASLLVVSKHYSR